MNKEFWEARYEDINNFEKHLTRNGTKIVKFFLNISKEEQRERFLDRIDDPDKHWKFSAADVAERGFWDEYMDAFEQCIAATSTDGPPGTSSPPTTNGSAAPSWQKSWSRRSSRWA